MTRTFNHLITFAGLSVALAASAPAQDDTSYSMISDSNAYGTWSSDYSFSSYTPTYSTDTSSYSSYSTYDTTPQYDDASGSYAPTVQDNMYVSGYGTVDYMGNTLHQDTYGNTYNYTAGYDYYSDGAGYTYQVDRGTYMDPNSYSYLSPMAY